MIALTLGDVTAGGIFLAGAMAGAIVLALLLLLVLMVRR